MNPEALTLKCEPKTQYPKTIKYWP